jgi:hypothetical protein
MATSTAAAGAPPPNSTFGGGANGSNDLTQTLLAACRAGALFPFVGRIGFFILPIAGSICRPKIFVFRGGFHEQAASILSPGRTPAFVSLIVGEAMIMKASGDAPSW